MIKDSKIKVRKACNIFNVSRSGYYDWKSRKPMIIDDTSLRKEIEGITLEFPFNGYRRVSKELHRRGITINHKKVLRIMREEKIICRRKKKFRPVTTQSDHDCRVYPNLTKDLKVTGLNQLWVGAPIKEQVGDLIYSRLRLMDYYKEGFVTLQLIMKDLDEMGCEADSFYCEGSDIEKLRMIRDVVGSDIDDEELMRCLKDKKGCEDLIKKKYATDIICGFSDVQILINNGNEYGLIDDDYSFRGTRSDLDRCNVIPVDRFKFVSVPEINGESVEYALFENYPYLPITPVEIEEYGDLLNDFNALLITKSALLAAGGVSFGSAYVHAQRLSDVVKTTAIFGGWVGATSVIDYSLHQLHPASADLASDIINTALFVGAGIVARHVVIKSGGRYRLAEYFSSEEARAEYVKLVRAKKVPGTEDVYRVIFYLKDLYD